MIDISKLLIEIVNSYYSPQWDEKFVEDVGKILQKHKVYSVNDIPIRQVRCKDCKHRPIPNGNNHPLTPKPSEFEWDETCPYVCADEWHNEMPDDNGFCSRGERKDERGMTPKTLTSIVVVFRINGVKYGRRMNFETEVAEEHIGFTKTVLEMLMRGMKTQAVIDDYKVYDEIRQVDEE